MTIALYQVIDPDSLNPHIEESFGLFFANVLNEEKSSSHKKKLLKIFNKIQVRELVFGSVFCWKTSIGLRTIIKTKFLFKPNLRPIKLPLEMCLFPGFRRPIFAYFSQVCQKLAFKTQEISTFQVAA